MPGSSCNIMCQCLAGFVSGVRTHEVNIYLGVSERSTACIYGPENKQRPSQRRRTKRGKDGTTYRHRRRPYDPARRARAYRRGAPSHCWVGAGGPAQSARSAGRSGRRRVCAGTSTMALHGWVPASWEKEALSVWGSKMESSRTRTLC